jgi:ABC-2 type transport system ATP-binding protein
MKDRIIEVSQLAKSFRTYQKPPGFWGAVAGLFNRVYQTTEAVKNISFAINRGECVGFLGRNGAGKTTTLKMLSGLVYPSSGAATVLGFTPWERHNDYRRNFSLVMGQKNQLWWDLPAWESLELNAAIYGLPRGVARETIDELTTRLEVREKLHTMVRELSLGERMKLELVASLLHRPQVLFLDEPTVGLDVVSQRTIRAFLKEYNQKHRTTILLTSHYMADIEALCARVIIIDRGRLTYDGKLSELVRLHGDFRVIRFRVTENTVVIAEDWAQLGDFKQDAPDSYSLRVKSEASSAACKALLDELSVCDFSVEEAPAEEVLATIYTRRIAPHSVETGNRFSTETAFPMSPETM